jgi:glycosyltransferase involved in cell wall biosynthesis
MHIAHFVQRVPPALGGSEAYFDRLARFHRDSGDTVTTFTTTAIDLEAFWQSGRKEVEAGIDNEVRRYRPSRFPGRRYILKAASLVLIPKWQALTLPCNPICPDMWRDASRYDGPLDAVHATAFPYAFPIVCGLTLARRRGVPFFLTPFLHLGDPTNANDKTKRQYTQRPLRWLLRQADRIFVQTNLERNAVQECGVPAEKIVLQGLGVDPAECTRGDREGWRRVLGIGTDEVVIGHLANLSVEKGSVDLLHAALALRKEGLPLRVVLAGPAMTSFRAVWNDDSNRGLIQSLGVVSDQQKRDFFAGIDLFCLPSRSDSFGLVLLEAWANRKPVVVFRAGGPSELVRHGVDGLVSDCHTEALIRSLREAIQSRTQRVQWGEAGAQRIDREFGWSQKLALVRTTIQSLTPPSPSASAQ